MTSDPVKFFQQTVLFVVEYFHSEESPCSFPSAERKAETLWVCPWQSSNQVSQEHLPQALQAVSDNRDPPASSLD